MTYFKMKENYIVHAKLEVLFFYLVCHKTFYSIGTHSKEFKPGTDAIDIILFTVF